MTKIKKTLITLGLSSLGFVSIQSNAATYEFRMPLKGIMSNESVKTEPTTPVEPEPEPEKDIERGPINKPAYCLNAALYMNYHPTQPGTMEFRTFTGFTNYCENNWNYDQAYFEKYAYLDCDKIAVNEQKLKGGATDKNTIMTESNKCLQGIVKPSARVDYYPPELFADKSAFCVSMVASYYPDPIDIPVLFDICMNEPDGKNAPMNLQNYQIMSAIVSADPAIYPILDNSSNNFSSFTITPDTITIKITPAPKPLSTTVKTISIRNYALKASYKCTNLTASERTLGANKTISATFTCKGDFKNVYAPSASYVIGFGKN